RFMKRRTMVGLELILPIAVVAVWWFASEGSSSPYFPPLREIFTAFIDTWMLGRNLDVLAMTLLTFAVGYMLAIVLGIAVGVMLAASRTVSDFVSPLVEFSGAI